MVGTSDHVLYAAIVFIAIHVLSSTPLRAAVVGRLGEGPFRGLFSLLSLATFGWLVWAHSAAPFDALWAPPAWTRWLALVLMAPATFFVVAGLSGRNPTLAGREGELKAANPATGVLTITRHPLFWGFALFAIAHLVTNGDRASTWLFGAIGLLALAGMPLQDRKKEDLLGAEWGPFVLRTSIVPFVAALQGRTPVDWAGIGWLRPGAAVVLYAVLLFAHKPLFGLAPWPV
jgi:uncharacterized membrane protein